MHSVTAGRPHAGLRRPALALAGVAGGAVVLLPGALTAWLGFSAGGFFAGTTALAAAAVLLVLLLRVTLAAEPFAGFGWLCAASAFPLALYSAWLVASSAWSGAPARVLLEFDRALLYLGLLLLFASFPRRSGRVRWMAVGLASAAIVVCLWGLAARLTPGWLGTSPDTAARLSYPITYWNALGLLAAVGAVLALHLATSRREPAALRVAGAAAVPMLAATLLLTYSRGAIAALALAVIAYLTLARPPGALLGLLATAPTAAFAVSAAYRIGGFAQSGATAPGAADGLETAALILAACAAAAVLRALALPLDRRSEWARVRGPARAGVLACVVAMAVAAALALDVPASVDRQYERFGAVDTVDAGADPRARLTNPGNNGRLEQWRVALAVFGASPLTGAGAGTFPLEWDRLRVSKLEVKDAHSLYLETLAELGAVGLALLGASLGVLLAGALWRCRGPDRARYAAVFAVLLAWAVHAGIDWDWEMPVTTSLVFCLGGATLASSCGRRPPVGAPGRLGRVVAGLLCLVVAVTPVTIALSQRRLDDGVRALRRGDCPAAVRHALGSIAAVDSRPEPFEVLGYCDARLGAPHLAQRAFERAIARDPRNWEVHYGLAVVRASGRRDPRPAVRATLALNPRGDMPLDAARRFRTADPQSWARRSRDAPLPIH